MTLLAKRHQILQVLSTLSDISNVVHLQRLLLHRHTAVCTAAPVSPKGCAAGQYPVMGFKIGVIGHFLQLLDFSQAIAFFVVFIS